MNGIHIGRGLLLASVIAPALAGAASTRTAGATPQTVDLYQGFNYRGPISGSVPAAEFVSCLGDSWSVVWMWEADTKTWRWHFPEGDGPGQVPPAVNDPADNGIGTIPRGRGVAIFVTADIAGAQLPNQAGEGCLDE